MSGRRSRRDDFSERTKQLMRERVGSRCSRPDCRKATTGPKLDSEDAVRLGKAAHITAAASGGPRYDPALTQVQRRHIDNGIWLCCDHADEVDSDKSRYTVEELRHWKAEAERLAHQEIGHPLPSRADAINQAIAVIGSAPAHFVPTAIGNTHKAMELALARLDSSVVVKTEYIAGQTIFHIAGSGATSMTLEAKGSAGERLGQAMAEVVRSGAEVEIPLAGVELGGSPLFQFLAREACALYLGGVPRPAVVRVSCAGDGSGYGLSVEFQGEARLGTELVSVSGTCFGGVLSTRLVRPLGSNGQTASWSIDASFSALSGHPITCLPHFERASAFVRKLSQDQPLSVEIEIDGHVLAHGSSTGPTDRTQLQSLVHMFNYVSDVQEIARHFAPSIVLPRGFNVEHRQIEEAEQIADLLRTVSKRRQLGKNEITTIPLRVSTELLELAQPGIRLMKFVTPARDVILFGCTVHVPSLTTILSDVELRLRALEEGGLQVGESAALECYPSDNTFMQTWCDKALTATGKPEFAQGTGEATGSQRGQGERSPEESA